ncbi:MAG: PleD family two-component system response regulator [Alphaproteobacteria bacterium]|nr:PleD family two-component system response regulator [Alphaproteobacteria bacterium]MBO6628330.1 PleD family two-component system response regulator [Alphaproteobacteria bacterium]MDF1624716.1 PleD family two-component system response regulator [Parvibaculaceae bacterium]
MTARVLIVDDVPANLKLLEAKLTAEYFDVLQASDGLKAIEAARQEQPDIILLDVMMPGMDGYEVCQRLKQSPETSHIPIVMVTALDQQSDRVKGLESGADDFLTKPINDIALFARVKSLVRLKTLTDELRMRETTGQRIGMIADADIAPAKDLAGRCLVFDDRERQRARICEMLSVQHDVTVADTSAELMDAATHGDFDLILVSLSLQHEDGLRICSQLKSAEATRQTPILAMVEEGDTERLVRALDMGVCDYLTRPVDRLELLARCGTQLRRKRYQDQLKTNFKRSMEMAVTDPLTGLYNRRYMTTHLASLMEEGAHSGRPLALMILDIDHFKAVNDTHGHAAGDEVLKEFARRVTNNVRGIDLACRLGGEEFVVVMPDTDAETALTIAERLRNRIAERAFPVDEETRLSVTVSIGLAGAIWPDDTNDALMERADQALYKAKRDGRNRVIAEAA